MARWRISDGTQAKTGGITMNKDTKILCTIGPASIHPTTLKRMVQEGMDAARINTAHTDQNTCKKIVDSIRKNADIPIILDIKGPELRIRSDATYTFEKGEILVINDPAKSSSMQKKGVHFNYPLARKLKKGDILLISDGKFRLEVIKAGNKQIMAKCLVATTIMPNRNLHIPNKVLDLPSLTKKDITLLKIADRLGIDYIALSFCRSQKDVQRVRNYTKTCKIIAKIENQEGITNIAEIIDAADGIMVARGDLGVELSPEKVPLIQKQIIAACNQQGKISIVATQMLESMITNDTPTRAEISDIANAILDGADCLMLSAESAIGKYPIKAVHYMARTAATIEPAITPKYPRRKPDSVSDAITHTIRDICTELPITKIICLTMSGHTAAMIARFRIQGIPIIAATPNEGIRRQLMLYYGIQPIMFKEQHSKIVVSKIVKQLNQRKIIAKQDMVVVTAGIHTPKQKKTNMLHIHKVDDVLHS